MDNVIQYAKYVGAGIATVLTYLYGGFDMILWVLMAIVVIDYITGVLCGACTRTLNSEIGYRGIAKKIGIFLVVAVAHILGQAANIPEIRSLVIGFYIANEGISILENAGKIGIPVPKKLLDALEQLKGEDE